MHTGIQNFLKELHTIFIQIGLKNEPSPKEALFKYTYIDFFSNAAKLSGSFGDTIASVVCLFSLVDRPLSPETLAAIEKNIGPISELGNKYASGHKALKIYFNLMSLMQELVVLNMDLANGVQAILETIPLSSDDKDLLAAIQTTMPAELSMESLMAMTAQLHLFLNPSALPSAGAQSEEALQGVVSPPLTFSTGAPSRAYTPTKHMYAGQNPGASASASEDTSESQKNTSISQIQWRVFS